MSSTLGEKLRQAREERGISISEVAEQTRISSLYLKSIEDDNYKPLPGGIFNKGFVKAYAKYVGIDEHEALQDYAQLIAENEPVLEDHPTRYRPEVLTDERSVSSLVPTIVFAGIILALMTGGILFVVSYIQNQSDSPSVATNTTDRNTNTAANEPTGDVDVAAQPTTPDEIRLEFRAVAEKVSVTSTVDGSLAYDEIAPETSKTYTAQQGVKLRYYRGFADKVQIAINGKQVAAPEPPPRGNIEFEVNKGNVAQILQTGQLTGLGSTTAATPSPAPPAVRPTPTTRPANTVAGPPPRTGTPSVRPAFTPQRTPRRTPTPIVVGQPPGGTPSPN